MMIKVESIARLPGSSHLISSLRLCIRNQSPALVSFASLSLSTFDAKSNSVVVSSEQPMTTIGGESVKEEVKLVAVKVSNPCPDMPSLKLQADECDHNTNPIVLWKVMVEKMGLPDGLDSGTSKGYGCCQTWSKIERRIATLEFDHDRKSMGDIVSSSSGRKSLLVKVYREVFEPLADFCARRVV